MREKVAQKDFSVIAEETILVGYNPRYFLLRAIGA